MLNWLRKRDAVSDTDNMMKERVIDEFRHQGNWRAGCRETGTSGSGEGVWKSAAR
ncbi:MAG: hypothetical protein GY797_13895 [Deltaproteobacteria bacterium]|nr:hypothetical protein [Deltaproteobacteria bacterium]